MVLVHSSDEFCDTPLSYLAGDVFCPSRHIQLARSVELMEPVVLFGIQFTLSLVIYALIAIWYVAPRLSKLPTALALAPLLWVHTFRVVGGTILAPGSVDSAIPA